MSGKATSSGHSSDRGINLPPDALLKFARDQVRAIRNSLLELGFSATAIWELFCRELLPAVIEERSRSASNTNDAVALLSAEGGCLSVAEATKRYSPLKPVTPQTLTRLIRTGQIIGVRAGGREYRVPVWQFASSGGLLEGLPEVLAALKSGPGANDSLLPFVFFLQTNPLIKGTPLAAIKKGRVDQVLRVAEAQVG